MNINPTNYEANKDFKGLFKLWQHSSVDGSKILRVEKRNTIVYTGADLLAYSLAGKANASISHMYIGYNNDPGFDVNNEPAVSKADTTFNSSGDYGYVRVPLSFPATFGEETNYDHNSVYFTVMLNQAPSSVGATFDNTSNIYSAGLVAALNPSGSNQDVLFAKIQFTPVLYDPTFGLTLTWGVKFTAA